MRRLEDLLRSIRKWYYKRQGYNYDAGKRMWFKTRSNCCAAVMDYEAGKRDKKTKQVAHDWWCTACKRRCEPVNEVIV